MIEIIINNSMCQIKHLPKELEFKLKNELQYLDQGVAYAYNHLNRELNKLEEIIQNGNAKPFDYGKRKGLQAKINGLKRNLFVKLYKNEEFPTGLLPKVIKILEFSDVEFKQTDLRIKPKLDSIKHILKEAFPPLRYYQRTSARLVKEKLRGVIVASTGTGKTLSAARMIWELGVKTLVITPSRAITDNMYDTLAKYFGKGKVERLNTKKTKLKDINICNIQSLVRMNPSLFNEIDAVFIDEFHHSSSTTYLEVNNNHLKNCYIRIGLTATNFRNDGSDLGLEGVLSEVLYEYTAKQAIEDGFLVKPEFYIIKNTINKKSENYQEAYKNGISLNDDRNLKIKDIAIKHQNESTIVLVQHIEHGENLKALIPNSEFINGKEKDDTRNALMNKYRTGEIKCLIGTGVIGEGVDLPIAKVLILAGGGKARSQVMQNIGRVLRPHSTKDRAIVYDFSDEGDRWLEEHALLRKEVYNDY